MIAESGAPLYMLLALYCACFVVASDSSKATCDYHGHIAESDTTSLLSYKSAVTFAASQHAESRDVQGMRARAKHDYMPDVAWRAFEAVGEAKRQLLEAGSAETAQPMHPEIKGSVFEAVEVSLPLEPPILKHPRDTGSGQGDKNIVGLGQLTRGGRKCIVYGMGIADDSSFEQQMQQHGCETHAFDCTVDPKAPSVANKKFNFHHWCIGSHDNVSFAGNTYVNGDRGSLTSEKKMQFKTLAETMKDLGHTYIDLLKFDIEGFEWPLFKTELLTIANPPEQLSFELHTQKANPAYVPQFNVRDKGYVQVNRLFRSLYDIGYRVTSKELNNGDPACAEFVAINTKRNEI